MDVIFLETLLREYSLSAIIIGLISYIMTKIIGKIFGDKMPERLAKYIPILIAIILEFILEWVLFGFTIEKETIYNGIIGASASYIIESFVEKKGNYKVNMVSSLIGEIVLEANCKTVSKEIIKRVKAMEKEGKTEEEIITAIGEILYTQVEIKLKEDENMDLIDDEMVIEKVDLQGIATAIYNCLKTGTKGIQ